MTQSHFIEKGLKVVSLSRERSQNRIHTSTFQHVKFLAMLDA